MAGRLDNQIFSWNGLSNNNTCNVNAESELTSQGALQQENALSNTTVTQNQSPSGYINSGKISATECDRLTPASEITPQHYFFNAAPSQRQTDSGVVKAADSFVSDDNFNSQQYAFTNSVVKRGSGNSPGSRNSKNGGNLPCGTTSDFNYSAANQYSSSTFQETAGFPNNTTPIYNNYQCNSAGNSHPYTPTASNLLDRTGDNNNFYKQYISSVVLSSTSTSNHSNSFNYLPSNSTINKYLSEGAKKQSTGSKKSRDKLYRGGGIEYNSFFSDYTTRLETQWESVNAKAVAKTESTTSDLQPADDMSGAPPHHPHGRQAPSSNSAWNHLQVPNYFPSRQPQHAHMSNEHPLLHQPTWHTPTTEPVKTTPHLFNLEQMITERQYPRHPPGVDLSLTRNGSQNGELPTTPISLSVRDTNKINSLPPGAIDIQAVELTKSLSPNLKSASPGMKSSSLEIKSVSPGPKPMSPGVKSTSPIFKGMSPNKATSPVIEKQVSPKNVKKSNKRVDSILERLNPALEKTDLNEKAVETSVITEKSSQGNLCTEKIENDKNSTNEKQSSPEKNVLEKQFVSEKSPEKSPQDKIPNQSVIVQPASSSYDENSNSSSIINAPTPTTTRDEDVISPYSNEDSMDSNKSRRKRKPNKTVCVNKDDDKAVDSEMQSALLVTKDTTAQNLETNSRTDLSVDMEKKNSRTCKSSQSGDEDKEILEISDRRRSSSEPSGSPTLPRKTRRKASSESETIANIAAMIQASDSKVSNSIADVKPADSNESKPISVSVIKRDRSKDTLQQNVTETSEKGSAQGSPCTPGLNLKASIQTPAQRKATDTNSFVEVENKLEEMFAGISEDTEDPLKVGNMELSFANESSKHLDLSNALKTDDCEQPSTSQIIESVTSTSNDLVGFPKNKYKRGRTKMAKSRSRRSSESNSLEITPKKKKKSNKKSKSLPDVPFSKSKGLKCKKSFINKQIYSKTDAIKDVYAYDSGSNASSSKSKGPFVQIRGPRDSPISVSIVNAPINEDDPDKKVHKSKKYHDDTEYRHKVRSKGLHCSTLSNKYDAQTRDASWICVFCKRGPHSTHSNDMPFDLHNQLPPPGDLFGPYTVTTNSPEFERRLDDPYDQHFRSKKVSRAFDNNIIHKPSKKLKRKRSESFDNRASLESIDNCNIYVGITEIGNKTYEVWAHEECLVWSPGVYLIGPKIIGLEEAVWTSCNVTCINCHLKGANVCCVKRGCTNIVHVGCAKISNWQLDQGTFKAHCVLHKTP